MEKTYCVDTARQVRRCPGTIPAVTTQPATPGITRLGTEIVNWYLVDDGGRLTAVDAALPGYERSLEADLQQHGYKLGDIEAVVLTHSDGDHFGMAARMHAAGVRVLVHSADEERLRKPGAKSGDGA